MQTTVCCTHITNTCRKSDIYDSHLKAVNASSFCHTCNYLCSCALKFSRYLFRGRFHFPSNIFSLTDSVSGSLPVYSQFVFSFDPSLSAIWCVLQVTALQKDQKTSLLTYFVFFLQEASLWNASVKHWCHHSFDIFSTRDSKAAPRHDGTSTMCIICKVLLLSQAF